MAHGDKVTIGMDMGNLKEEKGTLHIQEFE